MWHTPRMSRSRRHTPICGISCAESDKGFKRMSRHRCRRRADAAIAAGGEPEPERAYRIKPWTAPKEGKQYLRRCGADEFERCMRK